MKKFYILVALTLMIATAQAQEYSEQKLLNAAGIYLSEQKFDLAIEYSSKVIAVNPKNFDAWDIRGLSYMYKGETDLALQNYTEFIRLEPRHAKAYMSRAYVYRHFVNNKELALADQAEAIRISPIAEYYHSRGSDYRNFGEFKLSIPDLSEAIRLEPENDDYHYSRALTYLETNEHNLAIKDMSEAIRLKPDVGYYYTILGRVYNNKGEYELAIYNFTQALKRTSPVFMGDFYTDMISPLVRTHQFIIAKNIYSQFLSSDVFAKENEREPKSYFLKDYYKYYMKAIGDEIPNGLYAEALANLNLSVSKFEIEINNNEAKTQYADILALKGYVLNKLNRLEEAKSVYEQDLVINSNQPDVIQALTEINNKSSVVAKTDKTPPTIELISPQTERGLNIVSANEITQIIGRAKDASGIAQVTINGKDIKAEEDGLFVSTLPLKAGANEILISATDKQGNKASKTFNITGNVVAKQNNAPVEIVMPPTETAPKYHAILIASQDYTDASIPDLENPVKDAKDLKSILESKYTFNQDNIDTLFNRSREDILQSIVQKCNTLTENDNLIIFYAGHGIAEKDKFGDIDGYWIPSSARKGMTSSYISQDDINKALKRSNSKHILVIADACFSGSFTRSLADANLGIQKQYDVPSRKIMASGNLEPVPDNSKFLYYLKKNLNENREKYLTAKKLFDSFYEAILNNSDTSPQFAAIRDVGDEGGQFVFIKK